MVNDAEGHTFLGTLSLGTKRNKNIKAKRKTIINKANFKNIEKFWPNNCNLNLKHPFDVTIVFQSINHKNPNWLLKSSKTQAERSLIAGNNRKSTNPVHISVHIEYGTGV